jgi:CubicO group peptidase (beta-lactamase class C family)
MAARDDPRRNVPRALAVIERGVRERIHIGAQLYASLNGTVYADMAVGEARRGVALTADSLMLWMSSVKPVTAAAVLQLGERGLLALDDPVCRHLPEFAAHGKAAVTIRHVLTHTGGFPNVAVHWSTAPWDQIVAEICAAPLLPDWVPGARAAYHVASGWYVLGEIIRRLDGRDYDRYVREAIFEPLGMDDTWIGMPIERHRAYGDRIAPMHATELEPMPHPYWPWAGSAEACAVCRPGGNAWGPARELGRFYAALLNDGAWQQRRILQPESVSLMTACHSAGMLDETFQIRLDRGLGVVLDSKRYGAGSAWYGPRCSERTFGHGGYRCSVGFADPVHRLAVAVIFNGMPSDAAHETRMHDLLEALYADLGLGPAA